MESAFGLLGDGFALVAADCTAARSIVAFKHDEDKILELDSHKLLVGVGVSADSKNFTEFVQKNLKLYELNNDVQLSTHGAAHYIRGEMAKALRKGPYQTNLILVGYDQVAASAGKQPVSLFHMDHLASLSEINFGAHGYCAHFIMSIFDREWRAGLNLDQALAIVRQCVHELTVRFLVAQSHFVVKVVDANGTRVVQL